MKIVDLKGKRFGRLSVVSMAVTKKGTHKKWNCVCDCGNEAIVRGTSLTQSITSSCGCFRSERGKKMLTKHGNYNHPLYQTWVHMIDRCENPNSEGDAKMYKNRGISVCERWHEFENFVSDMGERPVDMSLDRIDNDGNYEPSNCKWSTPKEQANNRTTSVFVIHDGVEMTIANLCEAVGIEYGKFHHQYRTLGKSVSASIGACR